MTPLTLPQSARAHLSAWAREAYPREACGLLIGDRAKARIARVVRCANVADETNRYRLDPLEHLAAERAAGGDGLEVLGVWHTHPDHPARPSETDRAGAFEGWSYLIVSVRARGVGEVRSFRLHAGAFVEEPVR